MKTKLNISSGYIFSKQCPEDYNSIDPGLESWRSREDIKVNFKENFHNKKNDSSHENILKNISDKSSPSNFKNLENTADINQILNEINTMGKVSYSKKYIKLSKCRSDLMLWVSKVCSVFKFMDNTLFKTINIFDEVLFHLNFQVNYSECLLILLSALSISIKMLESKTLRFVDIQTHLAKNKFTKKQLIDAEIKVLLILKYKIPHDQYENFLYTLIPNLAETVSLSDEISRNLLSLCNCIYKLILFDYKLCRNTNLVDLYLSILIFGLSVFRKNSYITQKQFKHMVTVSANLGSNYDKVVDKAEFVRKSYIRIGLQTAI